MLSNLGFHNAMILGISDNINNTKRLDDNKETKSDNLNKRMNERSMETHTKTEMAMSQVIVK